MSRAILIGNGVTSQLIEDYKDYNMMQKVQKELGNVYVQIDSLLDPYRNLATKDEDSICELLKKSNIETYHYKRYFIDQSLLLELSYPHITALETLLKVAHLFHHIKEFDYNKIKSCANKIYYNEGMNGIKDINRENFNQNRFIEFINGFDYVFTTNFDNVLDDAYKGEVYHLHGGFYYRKYRKSNGSIYIVKEKKQLSFETAHLIWGRNSKEKENQTKGGFSFPMSFPFSFGSSIIDNYFNYLKNGEYEELHIWGYSGLNDNHINQLIDKNSNLEKIYCYVSPNDVNSEDALQKMNCLYNSEKKHRIIIKSWDDIWNIFEE